MKYTPFLIGNYNQGWVNNRKSFMIPEKAFSELMNAFIFRGRVKKKYGSDLVGRLRRFLEGESLTAAPGAGTTYTDNIITTLSLETNATLEPGSITITIGALITVTDNGDGTFTQTGGTATLDAAASSINYQTGDVTIELSAGAYGGEAVLIDFGYFPNLPVMGLKLRERATINNEQIIAFDTTYAYQYVSGAWEELPSTPAKTWTGSDAQFFQTTNFENPGTPLLFWATNYNGLTYTDPIAYYDDLGGTGWTNFTPNTSAGGDTLLGAVVLIPYKERMLAFNTFENVSAANTAYPQRVRYSQQGNIIDATNGWLSDVQGRGGYVDAPTSQAIVAVGQIRDRIIVYFERSTWELYYTGNEITPFAWRKINEELGAESTNSLIQFDNSVVGVGNVGIHSCNSDAVIRIDDEIPIQVYDFYNQESGYNRVYGIRDYYNEIVIWSYRDASETGGTLRFPNRQLIYNYRDNNWGGPWHDSYTVYGYQQRADDRTWAQMNDAWEVEDSPWYLNRGDSLFQTIVAGNQQGFVHEFSNDISGTAESRYIVSVTNGLGVVQVSSIFHNLEVDDYVQITDGFGLTWTANGFGENIFRVSEIIDNDTFEIETQVTGTYVGGQTLRKLDNMSIRTKFFIPFWKEARQLALNYVDFLFLTTDVGEVSYNLYVNDDPDEPVNDPSLSVGLFGASGQQNVIRTYPEENQPYQPGQRTIWHRNYSTTDCQTCQINIFLNDDQMQQRQIADSDFEMDAMLLYAMPVDGLL